MNVELILKDIGKININTLRFGYPRNCFVGQLLDCADVDRVLWYNWALSNDVGNQNLNIGQLSLPEQTNIRKYDLTAHDLLELSNLFEICEDDKDNTLENGYNNVVNFLKDQLKK